MIGYLFKPPPHYFTLRAPVITVVLSPKMDHSKNKRFWFFRRKDGNVEQGHNGLKFLWLPKEFTDNAGVAMLHYSSKRFRRNKTEGCPAVEEYGEQQQVQFHEEDSSNLWEGAFRPRKKDTGSGVCPKGSNWRQPTYLRNYWHPSVTSASLLYQFSQPVGFVRQAVITYS
ncbi:hypothetical protein FLAG1_00794 [Fusarium langsethiae]|uniref:Uncharacterized protein n=1 Tax=Fusarium langsethiae TaxID=179993 RepID=A0A0M9F4W6_FUSLA|nr:hypothetical protein FLAG1_00794 [Fusarium langsethiae]